MDRIEQRVRDSLQARADDVAPTPALWQEVDRRITRRKRLRVSVLALAGSAAVILGVLVLPGLFGNSFVPIEIEPFVQPEEPVTEDAAPEEAPGDEVEPGPTDEGTPDTTDGQSSGDLDAPPVLVADQNEIRLVGPDGDVTLHAFDPEGELQFVTGVAVRPGSTPDDLTAAVMTMAEGMFDLRHLRVIDGQVSLEVLPDPYGPGSQSPDGASVRVSNPVWSPNGDALAWLEAGSGDTRLRIIGWSGGPGSSSTADDNASFGVPQLPTDLNLNDWVDAGQDTTLIRGTIDDGGQGMYVIQVDRQADGAWSLSQEPELVPLDDTANGAVNAIAGTSSSDARSVRYAVRLGPEGFVLTAEGADDVDLPNDLLPSDEGGGDGLASLWVIDLGDQALVGSRSTSTAYLVDAGGLARIEGAAAGDAVQ